MSNKKKVKLDKTTKRVIRTMEAIDRHLATVPHKTVHAEMKGGSIEFVKRFPKVIIPKKMFKYFEIYIDAKYAKINEEPYVCVYSAREGFVNYMYKNYVICQRPDAH